MKIKPEYTGVWRLTEMSMWDRGYIDLVAPGHLTIKASGRGTFAFGAFEASVDCRIERSTGQARLVFTFAGWDEGDEMTGAGCAVARGDTMTGWFAFHLGDESTFAAERARAP